MDRIIAVPLRKLKVLGYQTSFRVGRSLAAMLRRVPAARTLLGVPSAEITDLAAWARTNPQASFQLLADPSRVRRRHRPPLDLDRVRPDLASEEIEFNGPFLAAIPNARVLGPNGVVITADGGILRQSTWSYGLFHEDRIFRTVHLPKPRRLDGPYYTLAAPSAQNYYHWVVEVLPRLFAYNTLGGQRPRLIVNSPLSSWQKESLALFNFSDADLLPLGNQYLEVEKLYLPSLSGINPHTLTWLRNTLTAFPVLDREQRLYITRRRAAHRRLLNEAEIEPLLLEHGFVIVETDGMPFAQQVQLFSRAQAIIAPHGAGLTNMAFAAPGCRIMEIVNPQYPEAMFYMLAEVLGHDYSYCIGEAVNTETVEHAGSRTQQHMRVDTQRFTEALQRLLST